MSAIKLASSLPACLSVCLSVVCVIGMKVGTHNEQCSATVCLGQDGTVVVEVHRQMTQ